MSAERQMTSTCRRLRKLEATIEAQRRVIDDLKAQHIDDQKERQRLAELLAELDEVIRPGGGGSAACTARLRVGLRF
jgi:septal ring factor EnvC (AmiA/AmiB activator)